MVGTARLDLDSQGQIARAPNAVTPNLVAHALITPELDLEPDKLPCVIDEVLQGTAVLRSRGAEACLDVIADDADGARRFGEVGPESRPRRIIARCVVQRADEREDIFDRDHDTSPAQSILSQQPSTPCLSPSPTIALNATHRGHRRGDGVSARPLLVGGEGRSGASTAPVMTIDSQAPVAL